MRSQRNAFPPTAARSLTNKGELAPLSARRLLVVGGIALILVGMILGDIFAVFVLHQNAGDIGENLLAATHAVASRDAAGAAAAFRNIGGFLENRGTKVDAHAHMISFGYIALLFALLQPYVALDERQRKLWAMLFLFGATLLPVGVFLIHYVGLAYSPLQAIGWASIFADLGGLLVFLACAAELAGIWRYLRRGSRAAAGDELLTDRSRCGRLLLSGGTLLVMVGFLHGAYYAGKYLYQYEAKDEALVATMVSKAAANDPSTSQAVVDYGGLQAAKAVNIAAHAHIIEFGLLAMLLAFFQPYVFLREKWKQIWAVVLLLGSLGLPIFVLMELRWGLVSGGLADVSGLLVVLALTAMLVGVIRYTGELDAGAGDFS